MERIKDFTKSFYFIIFLYLACTLIATFIFTDKLALLDKDFEKRVICNIETDNDVDYTECVENWEE